MLDSRLALQFIIKARSAKDISGFSNFPDEEEVRFLPNSEFHVTKVVTDHAEKKAPPGKPASYNLEDPEV